jgi:transcriptional antiterminator
MHKISCLCCDVMDRKQTFLRLERLKWLILHKATGPPKELANKLKVSERTVYRMIQDIREIHSLNIRYSNGDSSYIVSDF